MMRPGHRHGWAALTGAASTALVASAVLASTPNAGRTPSPPRTAPAPVPAAPVPGSIGLMAFLDPETGLLTGPIGSLVPPADQRSSSSAVVFEARPRANGAWLLDLKGTMLDYYVLHVDAFGRRTVSCAQSPGHVHLPAPIPAAIAAER